VLTETSGGGEKMKKKLLGFFGILFVVVMLTTPFVSAKPTSAANNPKSVSFMWHSENGWNDIFERKINPPWAEPDSPEQRVSHGKAFWYLNPAANNYVQIGDETPIPIDAETGYEGLISTNVQIPEPGVGAINYMVYEKIMWGDNNYIDIKCIERAHYDMAAGEFYAIGTFTGHGIIDGQKVQVTGIREGFFDIDIMAFVLECYGTIRFAGNTV
jgi:hypothetical protein